MELEDEESGAAEPSISTPTTVAAEYAVRLLKGLFTKGGHTLRAQGYTHQRGASGRLGPRGELMARSFAIGKNLLLVSLRDSQVSELKGAS